MHRFGPEPESRGEVLGVRLGGVMRTVLIIVDFYCFVTYFYKIVRLSFIGNWKWIVLVQRYKKVVQRHIPEDLSQVNEGEEGPLQVSVEKVAETIDFWFI